MKYFPAVALISATLATGSAFAAPVKYNIDNLHAWVNFKVLHLGFAQATGTMGKVNGTIMFDKDSPAASTVNAQIDIKGIHTGFDKRDAWIASDKVLNAGKNPAITFTSKQITVTGKNKGSITGDLTINGVSKPITMQVTFNRIGTNPLTKKETIGFSASAQFKRSDYGVKAFVGPLGDLVSVEIELEAVRAN
ncbi:MAG: polyisoprenoid-binding protein [Hyphomicrobiales bacterium]|nr:polyisoprenoid-binding protein [Hyphomicrobiales bacterium]